MEILELIDRLESLAAQARKVPITGRAMIDAERLLELVDQMRLSVPRNVQDANEIIERREQIINQTMNDARRLRATAEQDARALVDESELTKLAKRRSEEIMAEAEQRAERLMAAAETDARKRRSGADQYCLEALSGLEDQVSTLLTSIQAGQRVLTPANELLEAPEANAAISR